DAKDNSKIIEAVSNDLGIITGQKAVVCKAKKSVANFKVRQGMPIGVKEQLIFPEIEYDKIDKVRGMDICIVTTATTDEEARELLTLMGAPFAK
ncbi:MAG: 50S ribosomal protein L5, partial [Clostridia bacterium]|nr:50S ribosomal protein L5 [Clostridia bacterium]